jgi:hypothetical protein
VIDTLKVAFVQGGRGKADGRCSICPVQLVFEPTDADSARGHGRKHEQLLTAQDLARSVKMARLTAPESVGRRCAQLRGSGANLALGPRLVHGALAVWMQTTGAVLLAVKQGSLLCMWLPAQDGRSVRGLLYPTAVRDDPHQQGNCQGRVDINPARDLLPRSRFSQVSIGPGPCTCGCLPVLDAA